MNDLLAVALPFFCPVILGYLAGRFTPQPRDGLAWLNFFVVYCTVPPMLYQVISKTPLEQAAWGRFILGTTTAVAIAYAITALIALALRRRSSEAVIAGVTGSMGNLGYMGPGLMLAALGAPAVAPMALILAMETLFFYTLIPLLMGICEGSNLRGTARVALVRLATSPFLLSVAAGVAGSMLHLELPTFVERSLDMLKVAAAPTALFAIGVTVALRPVGHVPAETAVALGIKLLVHPLLVLCALSLLGSFDPVWVHTAMLMAALPPAVGVYVMATQFDVYIGRASTAVLMGTLGSIPTLLGWLYLLQNDLLPVRLFVP